MINSADKKRKTLMKRRVTAIIVSAAIVLVLAIALAFVLDYVRTLEYADVDGSTYYIRKRDGVYSMYDPDRNKLDMDTEHGYYITAAGTLVEVDAETGEYEVIAVVDTEGNEVVGFNSRLLLFPHIEKKNILSLEVHNSHGTYTFARYNEEGKRDIEGDFVIESSPLTLYNQELFASLYVGAGYTILLMKLEDPIKDENGEFSEYGLVPETRTMKKDEEGNLLEEEEQYEYSYEPAWYILTDKDGNRYKVIVGDPLVTGGGYYVQYVDMSGETEVKRDAVYVLDNDTGTSLTAPIEYYVTPTLSYPMSMNNYFDVEDFTIGVMKDGVKPGDTELYNKIISFTYIDLSVRENTLAANFPYTFSLNLDGYTPSSNNIDACLYNIYSPTNIGVPILSPSDQDLAEYGIYAAELDENGAVKTDENGNTVYTPFAKYTIGFKYDILDDNNEYLSTIHQLILISEKNEDGNYYAYTLVSNVTEQDGEEKVELMYTYDMVVEVAGHTFAFLEWDQYDWVNSSYISANIAYVTEIKIESPNYNVTYHPDNSLSPADDGTNSNNLFVNAFDSNGNSVTTMKPMQFTDKNGFNWVVTDSDIKVYEANGTERKIASGVSFYDYNVLGSQVLCRNGYIECTDKKVEVTANTVRIIYANGTEESFVRYNTSLFRKFYQTLLYATIVDSYEMTDEEEQALVNDESKWLMTLTFTTKDVDGTTETKVYKFYQLSSRKAYITINGNGGFYVQRTRVDKFITDSQRFFNNEIIEPTDKT